MDLRSDSSDNFGEQRMQTKESTSGERMRHRKRRKGVIIRDRIRQQKEIGLKQNTKSPGNVKSVKTLNYLKVNGITVQNVNTFQYFFCEFCRTNLSPVYQTFIHIRTKEHKRNSNDTNWDPLDKLLLIEPNRRADPQVAVIRRQELNKISELDKQKLVRHGIRLKDGAGNQAYVCIQCHSSLSSFSDCLKHYSEFLDKSKINHKFPEDNSSSNQELRYIQNSLDANEEKRYLEDFNLMLVLREEGIHAFNQSLVDFDLNHFICILCDKYFQNTIEVISHIKNAGHLKNRSSKGDKGMDKGRVSPFSK